MGPGPSQGRAFAPSPRDEPMHPAAGFVSATERGSVRSCREPLIRATVSVGYTFP